MKRYYNISTHFNVFHLIQCTNPIAFNLIDNGDDNFILGWSNSAKNILEFNSEDYFNQINDKENFFFGYFGYDLKNMFLPNSQSNNKDLHSFPNTLFFKAEHVIIKKNNTLLYFGTNEGYKYLLSCLKALKKFVYYSKSNIKTSTLLVSDTNHNDYLNTINIIKDHIQNGDSYELNFCTQFYSKDVELEILPTYQELRAKSKAPFSSLLSINHINVLSASPERYLRREQNKLISQPIKGTAPRSTNLTIDQEIKTKLVSDQKEISENIMIVDLVRNDFSKIATKNSVRVDELCKVYTFPTVHQLISTVSCNISCELNLISILKATFPMGSMTGAPKLISTQLIDQYENFKRGIYSGSVGFLAPNNSFDFNVVIRSILYNSINSTASCSVGGAITIKSIPESEYQECLLKFDLIKNILA